MTRYRTQENINILKEDLMKQDWGKVYIDNVNEAYDSFLNIVTSLYEKKMSCSKKGSKIEI